MEEVRLISRGLTSEQIPLFPENVNSLFIDNNELTNIDFLEKRFYKKVSLNSNKIVIEKLNNITSEYLSLDNNNIKNLEINNCKINTLSLTKNKITEIKFINSDIHTLNLGYNNISCLESFPENIKLLFLQGNQIETLSQIPESIEQIDISNNNLRDISFLNNKNFVKVNLMNNNNLMIDRVYGIKSNFFILSYCGIKDIVFENCNLDKLDLMSNDLEKINFINSRIIRMNLSLNKLKEFLNFPEQIQEINIEENELEKIAIFPDSLIKINLSNNSLNEILNIPKQLKHFDLSENFLTNFNFDDLPEKIEYLDITKNRLDIKKICPDYLRKTKNIDNFYYDVVTETNNKSNINKIENLKQDFSETSNPNEVLKIINNKNIDLSKIYATGTCGENNKLNEINNISDDPLTKEEIIIKWNLKL